MTIVKIGVCDFKYNKVQQYGCQLDNYETFRMESQVQLPLSSNPHI